MLISELAERCGTTVHALRHYEKCGLLQPARRANGWRDYPAALQREVVFITMSRAIGFSLREIGEWLPAYRSRRLTLAQLDEIMAQRLADIDARLAERETWQGRLFRPVDDAACKTEACCYYSE